MRTPSVKTLQSVFGDKAKQAREIMKMTRGQLIAGPAAVRFADCFHPPETCSLRLYALDKLGETHGIEQAESSHGAATYLNAGDIYNPTVIYWHGIYRVQCFGDFVETQERKAIKFK